MDPVRIELHLTYRCDLACWYCNRGCRLRTDHTPDLEVSQFERFLADPVRPEIGRIILIGGEPTLHPELMTFARMSKATCKDVRIYSNAYRPEAREVLARLKAELDIGNTGGTDKAESLHHDMRNIYVSPWDAGLGQRERCMWAGCESCGYSVDALGITMCAIGGAVDGILGLGVRSWDWSEVLEPGRLMRLCRHCGANYGFEGRKGDEAVAGEWRGQRMSGRWMRAMEKGIQNGDEDVPAPIESGRLGEATLNNEDCTG